jgi:hypothetical protein
MEDIDIEIVAHHEAGHVLSYLQQGHPFEYVSLVPGDGHHGHVYAEAVEMPEHAYILTCLAGPAAEALALGMDHSDAVEYLNDCYGASAIDGMTHGDFYEAGPNCLAFIDVAVTLAESNWPTIQKIAAHLLKADITPYAELEQFCNVA